jgi:hypothetical protein
MSSSPKSSGSHPSYSEPTKIAARTQSLTHAVELLTTRREDAAIVPADHVTRVRDHLLASKIHGDRYAGEACRPSDIESWQSFRAASVGTRSADQLTVAYLAGPDPRNDLLALVELGLRPENIWAFEMDAAAISSGLSNLEELGLRGVKFIPVSIGDYFVSTPRRFDIIYIDACGPLPSDKAATARLMVDVFKHSALAPLGVLVTNFSKPDITKPATLEAYAFLVAAYLFPKGFMESAEGYMTGGAVDEGHALQNADDPGECFHTEVKTNFELHYGAFITRHIYDIASIIAPMMRLINSDLYKVLFVEDRKAAIARGRRYARFIPGIFADVDGEDEEGAVPDASETGSSDLAANGDDDTSEMDGDAIMAPSSYSLLWTLAACGFIEGGADFDPPPSAAGTTVKKWKNQLTGTPQGSVLPEDVISAFYAWRYDASLWSPAMQQIANFPYADLMPFLCDYPNQELGFFPAFAQLAYPAHGNIREAKRFRYVAEGKSTEMFLDVMAFDECRYVYDWLSAMHLVPDDWYDLSSQLTFRFALDAIVKDRRWFGDDFLYGCHSVGEDEDFPTSELAPRVNLSKDMSSAVGE